MTKIWKTCNVSTLLVLPIFDGIIKKTKTKIYPQIKFPFILLAYEYGLINSYLFTNVNKEIEYLYTVFSKRVLEDLELTNSSYFCLEDRILDYKGTVNSFLLDSDDSEDIVYVFKIPEKLLPDVKLITESKYSQVSEDYKELLRIKTNVIPNWYNKLGSHICKQNMSHSIVTKQKHLKEQMIKAIGQNFSNSQEFYIGFDHEREQLCL